MKWRAGGEGGAARWNARAIMTTAKSCGSRESGSVQAGSGVKSCALSEAIAKATVTVQQAAGADLEGSVGALWHGGTLFWAVVCEAGAPHKPQHCAASSGNSVKTSTKMRRADVMIAA
jgi:hypothetical protein